MFPLILFLILNKNKIYTPICFFHYLQNESSWLLSIFDFTKLVLILWVCAVTVRFVSFFHYSFRHQAQLYIPLTSLVCFKYWLRKTLTLPILYPPNSGILWALSPIKALLISVASSNNFFFGISLSASNIPWFAFKTATNSSLIWDSSSSKTSSLHLILRLQQHFSRSFSNLFLLTGPSARLPCWNIVS